MITIVKINTFFFTLPICEHFKTEFKKNKKILGTEKKRVREGVNTRKFEHQYFLKELLSAA